MQGAHFTPITFTSATLADFGGHQTGCLRDHYSYEFGCWQQYVLVLNGTAASGTIADGLACMQPGSLTTTGRTSVVKVVITTGAAVGVFCVNNLGKAVPGDHYFWALQRGIGYGKGGTIGDGLEFSPAANGLIGAASGATDTLCGHTISDVTTDTANKVFWALPASGPAA